jgi:hypothetical protein
MPPSELYLVGTVHNDLRGPRRLITILDHLCPDVVSVESTEKDAVNARARIDDIYAQVGASGLAWVVTKIMFTDRMSYDVKGINGYRFERECAYAWSLLNAKTCVAVEREWTPALRATIVADVKRCAGNLSREYADSPAPANDYQKSVDDHYRRAVVHGLPVNDADRAVLADRDPAMAQRLRALEKRVVHISGVMHISGRYKNLAHHCEDLEPTLMTLYDAESIIDEKCRKFCEAIGLPTERLSAASPSR